MKIKKKNKMFGVANQGALKMLPLEKEAFLYATGGVGMKATWNKFMLR